MRVDLCRWIHGCCGDLAHKDEALAVADRGVVEGIDGTLCLYRRRQGSVDCGCESIVAVSDLFGALELDDPAGSAQ